MPYKSNQYTIKKQVSCYGVGLHSGKTVHMVIKPASAHNGIRFFRSDLSENNCIPARFSKVSDTKLATTISNGTTSISTTEHLMAALIGLGIDNADIEVDSAEVPIMDGSAGPFLHLLKKAGKQEQNAKRKIIKITKKITYKIANKSFTISPYKGLKVSADINFQDTFIKKQYYKIKLNSSNFEKEIATARTFGYVEQVEELWNNGLALGSTLNNVIAIHWDKKRILNEDGLRFNDEFIRHKVLDIIGDLALLGHRILGHVTASGTGHTDHLAFMKTLIANPDCWELTEQPEPIFRNKIKSITKLGADPKIPIKPLCALQV